MNASTLIKITAFRTLRYLGIQRLLRRQLRDRLTVLCYHGVVPDAHPDDELRHSTTVSVADFRDQLQILQRHFHVVSPHQVLDWVQGGGSLPPFPVLLTFDDGFRNNLTLAAPELQRASTPALLFLATGYIGTDRVLWPQELVEMILRWPDPQFPLPTGEVIPYPTESNARQELVKQVRAKCKLGDQSTRENYMQQLRARTGDYSQWDKNLYQFLNWDDVRAIRSMGVEIGAHTVDHPILSRISSERVRQELTESKRRIESELGEPCHYFAYPNGTRMDYNESVKQIAREAGYGIAFSLNRTTNRKGCDPMEVDRVDVAGHTPREDFYARVNGLFSMLNGMRGMRNRH